MSFGVSTRLRRRELLAAGGALGVAGLIARYETGEEWLARLRAVDPPAPTVVIDMVRPEDQLALSLRLINFVIAAPGTGGPGPADMARLVRPDASQPSLLVAEFPPQFVAEEAVPEDANGGPPAPPPPLRARLAGPSRLVFRVTADHIPLTDEALLSWASHAAELAPNAVPASSRPSPKEPTSRETAIEYPWRLTLSPASAAASWEHRTAPVSSEGRTELWHTRMVTPAGAGGSMRAIHSPDWKKNPNNAASGNGPFVMSLKPRHRSEIVGLTSDWAGFPVSTSPRVIRAEEFILSPLGAFADLSAKLGHPTKSQFQLTNWESRATLGREHWGKVVERGYLFPFGHQATLTAITERKFQGGRPVAVLRRREFITVTEPERAFGANDHQMPFKSVRIVTKSTPPLDPAAAGSLSQVGKYSVDKARWPVVLGRHFEFEVVATDVEGATVEFRTPLVFVGGAAGTKSAETEKLSDAYTNGKLAGLRQVQMGRQEFAYAEPVPGESRSTAFATEWVRFGSKPAPNASGPKFKPVLERAAVAIPALEQLHQAGAQGGAARGVPGLDPEKAGLAVVKMAQSYVENGFKTGKNQNPAQAYLETVKQEGYNTALDYAQSAAGDLVGGLAQPNMDIGALSRTLGPIGANPADLLTKLINPASLLGDAKFLGVPLGSVLAKSLPFPVPPVDPAAYEQQLAKYKEDLAKLPSTIVKTVYAEAEDAVGGVIPRNPLEQPIKDVEQRIPKELRYEYEWRPEFDPAGTSVFKPQGAGGEPASMLLRAVTVIPLNIAEAIPAPPQIPSEPGGPLPEPPPLPDPAGLVGEPTYEVIGDLKNFALTLGSGPEITVYFNRVLFEARSGKKPDVDVDIHDVRFGGHLTFVEELREWMSSPGNGLAIDINGDGVTASYSTAIDDVAMGAFSLTNMTISAGVVVPFDDRPVGARFAFCSREEPFLLTYGIFGGGGYALVEVNPQRLDLEVSLEFGAAAAVNLGVASGAVQMMAGFILRMEGSKAQLSGTLRVSGELDVLGLIRASMLFLLTLSYDGSELYGQATVSIEIEVACFSESVKVTCEKRFGRSGELGAARNGRALRRANGDGPAPIAFEEIVPEQAVWDRYVASFAPEAFA